MTVIGMQLYLITVLHTKDIKGYNISVDAVTAENKEQLTKHERFPFDEYCLQRHLLPDAAKRSLHSQGQGGHGLRHWIENDNISKALSDIKPPFVNPDNKCCLMEMPEERDGKVVEQGGGGKRAQFGRRKQFVSSTHMNMVSKQLEANAVGLIGKRMIATMVDGDCGDDDLVAMEQNEGPQRELSLFDMLTK